MNALAVLVLHASAETPATAPSGQQGADQALQGERELVNSVGIQALQNQNPIKKITVPVKI